MEIYLLGQLLVQSQVYDDAHKESTRREKIFFGLQRDWNIALWNCGNKLDSGEDYPAGHEIPREKMIEVGLKDYPALKWEQAFRFNNIPNPEKILFISGYHSFIETPRNKIISLVHQLEKAEIDCLVGHNGIPLPHDYDYASPRIKEKFEKKGI